MSLLNLLWAGIILFLTQDVVCYIPERQVNLHGDPLPNGANIPMHDMSDEEGGRAVYDPGDELLKTLNEEDANNYIDFLNEVRLTSNKENLLRKLEAEITEEQDIVSKSVMLMKLLEDPAIGILPLVYIEDTPLEEGETYPVEVEKRSRYYRRYPWKRHSSRNRGTYEPDARYLCVPSKEDVFKLLIGIHENRKGNHHKTVNFCNRKRPAKAIFTNIRFLG